MWKGAGPAGGPTHIRNSKRGLIEAQVLDLLPSPRTSDTNGPGLHGTGGMDLRTAVTLLPTTTAMDYKASGGAEGSSNVTLTDAMVRGRGLLPTPRATRGGSGTETMYELGAERTDEDRPQGQVLLQTPSVADGMGGHLNRSGARKDEKLLPGQAQEIATNWGPYEPAIRRWEAITRPAPPPTEPNSKGGHRLSPRFTEWMMGVPDGWICGVDVSRNEKLKAAGNGVVPQQATAALRDMLTAFQEDR